MKRSQRGSRVLRGLEHGKPSDEDREELAFSSQTSLSDEGSVAGETTERRGEQSSMSAESCGQEAASSTMSATTTAPSASTTSDCHDDRKQGQNLHGKTSSVRKIQRRSASLPSESKRRVSSHQRNQSLEMEIARLRKEIKLIKQEKLYFLKRVQGLSVPVYRSYISPVTGVHHHVVLRGKSVQPPGKVVDTTISPSLLSGTQPFPFFPVLGPDEASSITEPPSKVFGLDTQMPVSANTSISTISSQCKPAPPRKVTETRLTRPSLSVANASASVSPAVTSIQGRRNINSPHLKLLRKRRNRLSRQLHELRRKEISLIRVCPRGPEGQKLPSHPVEKAGVSYTTIPSLKDTSDAPSSNITLSNSAQEPSKQSSSPKLQSSLFQSCEGPEEQSAEVLTPQNRNATDDGSLPFHTPTSTSDVATTSVTGPPCPENSRIRNDSIISTAEDTLMDLCMFELSGLKSQLGDNHNSSRSMPSLSETPSTRNRKQTHRKRSQSLPDITLQDSFERFTPEISDDENSETYRFQCTSPGLYQCSVTGLVFNMEGEGDVTYRIVHWDRRLLAQHHKKPAGPLFDIRCQQQSVCQLHLPHCEIRSTDACEILSVAHVTDKGTEFIRPHEKTETHVVINITGFSRFGVARDENSRPAPIKAAVFLFYTPVDSSPISVLNVLLLPGNVVLRDVQNQREKRNALERYIEVPPQCQLYPKQKYLLSTPRKNRSIRIQPKKAEFDGENYHNFLTTFQVILKVKMESIKLLLKDRNSSHCVWRNRVYLSSAAVRRPQVQGGQDLTSVEILRSVWEPFINRVSGPMLKSLLDRLHHNGVISKSEREEADAKEKKREMASFGINMVIDKGERASSEMITFLCEEDKYLSETLGLM